jgi:hypothetical protein
MFPTDRGPTSLFERLRDRKLYAAALERVRAKQHEGGGARPLVEDGPFLQALSNPAGLVRALARDVSGLEYRLSPAVPRRALIQGQPRTLHVSPPLDEIVLGALAEALQERLEACLSPRLFSYRRGRSSLQAIRELLDYLRTHRSSRSQRRQWGLYVLRRDVRGYGDAIASGPGSQLWPLLAGAAQPLTEPQLEWLRGAFRLADPSRERGIPTGSPLQPAACNLYLTPLDRLLESVPGGFYARYGDDMLFAHPDPAVARELAPQLDRELAFLALEWSRDKCADLFFNLAGRRPEPHAVGFRGAAALDYLGFRIDFHGVIGLKRVKQRQLLRDLATRLQQSARLLAGEPAAERARDLCAIANAALDPSYAGASPAALALRYLVSDRGQLRDLDYKIALLVAERASARRGVRAFRDHPPARLRDELGLASLVGARNRAGRRPRTAAAHG